MGHWGRTLAVLIVLLAGPSAGETSDDEVAGLKAEIQHIREENRALQAQVSRQEAALERLESRLQAMDTGAREPSTQAVAGATPVLSDLMHVPSLTLRGFADFGYSLKLAQVDNTNSFALGAADLYMTSELTDRVSVLVEANFGSNSENAATFNFQRGLIKYWLSDLVRITAAARMHTPLGYQAYHHGSWLQTTIFRPEIYLFEGDDGGFLPVHSVGVDVSGSKEWDALDLEYNFGIFNGRGRTVTEIQHLKDKNDGKAVNLRVGIKPHLIEGLALGGDIYLDEIPGNPPAASRRADMDERILGGYLVYTTDRVELLSELFHIFHDDKTSGEEFSTVGLYVQGSYSFGRWKPYYRFDRLDVANGDPFFTAPRDQDRLKHTLGLRWDPFAWNAIKFEYSFTDLKRTPQDNDEHALSVNSSYAF